MSAKLLCSLEFPPFADEGVPQEFESVGSLQRVLLQAVSKKIADLNRPLTHFELMCHYPCQLVFVFYVEWIHSSK